MSDLCNHHVIQQVVPVPPDGDGVRLQSTLNTDDDLRPEEGILNAVRNHTPVAPTANTDPLVLAGLDPFGKVQAAVPVLVTDERLTGDPAQRVLKAETLAHVPPCLPCWDCGGEVEERLFADQLWTSPVNDSDAQVEATGAGGAGGGNAPQAAGGGSGGAYAIKSGLPVTPGQWYLVRVAGARLGTGGDGDAGDESALVGDGGVSCVAQGGVGGTCGSDGGAGGTAETGDCEGDTVHAGGDGAAAATTTAGGGGGGAGSAAGGNDATGATGGAGGTAEGGHGGTGRKGYGAAAAGVAPGGGGAGASGHCVGGFGGAGRVVLTHAGENSPELLTASGCWLCPPGVTSLTVECWGGGAAGGGNKPLPGGGGAGGATAVTSVVLVKDATHVVEVGEMVRGGAGDGADGGGSAFGSYAVAQGGPGGARNGGPGGVADISESYGDNVNAGGDGERCPPLAGGGAGGNYAARSIPVTLAGSYAVVVGAARPGTADADGEAGQDSSFTGDGGVTCLAKGNPGGKTGGHDGSPGGSGGLASTTGCIGDVIRSGGDGADGDFGYSGAGGGAPNAAADGHDASGAVAGASLPNGGGRGGVGRTSCDAGDAGLWPGGGGGGAGLGAGGAGAAGLVILEFGGGVPPVIFTASTTWTNTVGTGVVTARCWAGGAAGGGVHSLPAGGGGGGAAPLTDGSDGTAPNGGSGGAPGPQDWMGKGGGGASAGGRGGDGLRVGGGGGGAGESGLGGRGGDGRVVIRYTAPSDLAIKLRRVAHPKLALTATVLEYTGGVCCAQALEGFELELVACPEIPPPDQGIYPCETLPWSGGTVIAAWAASGSAPRTDSEQCHYYPPGTTPAPIPVGISTKIVCVQGEETEPPFTCSAYLVVRFDASGPWPYVGDHDAECCNPDGTYVGPMGGSFFGFIQLSAFEQLCGQDIDVVVPVYADGLDGACETCQATIRIQSDPGEELAVRSLASVAAGASLPRRPVRKRRTLGKVLDYAVALLGPSSSPELAAARLAQCSTDECGYLVRKFDGRLYCGGCGCGERKKAELHAKVTYQLAQCPTIPSYWDEVEQRLRAV